MQRIAVLAILALVTLSAIAQAPDNPTSRHRTAITR